LDHPLTPLEAGVSAGGFLGLAVAALASELDYLSDWATLSVTDALAGTAPVVDFPDAAMLFMLMPLGAFTAKLLRARSASRATLVTPEGLELLGRFDAAHNSLALSDSPQAREAASVLRGLKPGLLEALSDLFTAREEGATPDALTARLEALSDVVVSFEAAAREHELASEIRLARQRHSRSEVILSSLDATTFALGAHASELHQGAEHARLAEESVDESLRGTSQPGTSQPGTSAPAIRTAPLPDPSRTELA
jgi:hypothetical protein